MANCESEANIREMLERLARIETKLESGVYSFQRIDARLNKLEAVVGRQNLVASILGALAAGTVLALKYLFSGVHR